MYVEYGVSIIYIPAVCIMTTVVAYEAFHYQLYHSCFIVVYYDYAQ